MTNRTGIAYALTRGLVAAALSTLAGCGHLSSQYVMPGYGAHDPQVVKHVVVRAWAPNRAEGLAPVVAQVASDLIKLRKNYLVHDAAPEGPTSADGGPSGCADGIDGVLFMRILDEHTEPPQNATLHGSLTLLRCTDGAHVFRSEGQVSTAIDDRSLADLRNSYGRTLGEAARRWAAPAFALVQALAEPLPNPELNDGDIEAKIELGAL